MLQQRSVPRQPISLRDRMQHGWLGTGRIEPMSSGEKGFDPTGSRQLEKQQPRRATAEQTCEAHGQNQQPKTSPPSTAPKPPGWSRWSNRSSRIERHGSTATEATRRHGYGRTTIASSSRSSRWKQFWGCGRRQRYVSPDVNARVSLVVRAGDGKHTEYMYHVPRSNKASLYYT